MANASKCNTCKTLVSNVLPANLIMFYMTPSEKNPKAKELFRKNIFSVTRQLQYSRDKAKLALDMAIFINGLPVITCELKNRLTGQDEPGLRGIGRNGMKYPG